MPPLATIGEFEARLGRTLAGAELVRANSALDDASGLVLTEGDPTWTDTTVPPVVATVVLQLARRLFENPDGAVQKSIGDVSLSYGRDGATHAMKPAERRTVKKAAGMLSAGTVQLAGDLPAYTGQE